MTTGKYPSLTEETARSVAPLIDHTILKTEATEKKIISACEEAVRFGFCAVCVYPIMIHLVARELSGTKVKPCTVTGFPHGASTKKEKAFSAGESVRAGAEEIDMVICISALKAKNYSYVADDIQEVETRRRKKTVKVIIETCLLSDEEKITACKIIMDTGAHFVKTSTGMAGAGASEHDVLLIRKTVGENFGVKASGGIRTLNETILMIKAGANRIGTSSGVAIVTSKG